MRGFGARGVSGPLCRVSDGGPAGGTAPAGPHRRHELVIGSVSFEVMEVLMACRAAAAGIREATCETVPRLVSPTQIRLLRGATARVASGLSMALLGLEVRDGSKVAAGLERIRCARDEMETLIDRSIDRPIGPLAG